MHFLKKLMLTGFLIFLCSHAAHAALFTVNDSADTTAVNTLRWAISQANSTVGTDDIRFGISATFIIGSALPTITDPVTISGGGNTLQATGNFSLFLLGTNSDGSILQNMILNNNANTGTGIDIDAGNITIRSCIIGTDWTNDTTVGFTDGIVIDGYGNLVGGDGSLGEGNIISCNTSSGVVFSDGEGNSACGNIIGLNASQDTDLGNHIAGVAVFSCDENAIGLPISGLGNVISGNGNYGIYHSGDKSTIQQNIIGANSTDTATFANGTGIYLSSSTLCQIGGDSTANQGNIISGNGDDGIYIADSHGITICGNIIGLNAAQNTDWGNSGSGVFLDNSDFNTIGAPTTGWGNIISENDYGIRMDESSVNTIQNNIIGLNAAGEAFGNDGEGIWMYGSYSNLIGGDGTAGDGNVISGNNDHGLGIYNDCSGNTIAGNIIGLDPTQSAARGNDGQGISLYSGGHNAIGLPITGWGNVICSNDRYGIYLSGSGNETVQNNLIGINSSGADFGQRQGIFLSADNNLIGGDSTANQGNVISGNNEDGTSSVGLYVTGGTGNRVCGNTIGLSPDQSTALTNYRGIRIASSGNIVGEPTAGWGNVISGNDYAISMNSADNTTLQNNIIGLNASGASLPNTSSGIQMTNTDNCLIGGSFNPSNYETNVISGNGNEELLITNSFANTISGNYFNTSLDGLSVIDTGGTATVTLASGMGNLIGGSSVEKSNLINGTNIGIQLQSANTTGNTVTGNFINYLADGSVPSSGMSYGINITSDAFGNKIGIPGIGDGNLIAGVGTGIRVDGASTIQNGIYGNTITAMSTAGIDLTNSGNGSKAAPVISTLDGSSISGTSSGSTDFIEIFEAESGAGNGGSLTFLGSTTAVGGLWSTTVPSYGGQWVCATASDSNNNTSAFSANVQNTGPTPTASPTATITETPTMNPTVTVSPTATISPIVSSTPTVTTTPTVTQTPDNIIDFNGKKSIAYPNPGKNLVTFAINSDVGAEVMIHIYNLNGELVAKLESTLTNDQRVIWNCPDVAPGIYIARIQKNNDAWEKIKIAIVK